MASISPTAEYINSYLKELTQDELRESSGFDLSIPGVAPIKKTQLASYRIKDCSEMFKRDRLKSKTQQIPRATGFTANTRVPGTQIPFQNVTRTYRNITIDTPIEVATKISDFDQQFFNLPINEQQDILARMNRAISNKIHTSLFALVSAATQATYAGGNIGSATTLPTLDVYHKLRANAEADKHPTGEPMYNFLYTSQATYLAAAHGFDAAPSAFEKPYNGLGDRGVNEFETGNIIKPIMGIKTCSSQLVSDGSVATSTYNLFIVGENKLGAAFGHVSGFKVWNDNDYSEQRMKFELEYGVFILDERAVYKYELEKNPAI